MEFILQFSGTTTGQEGVGFTQIHNNQITLNRYGVGYVNGAGCRYDQVDCDLSTDWCNKNSSSSYDSGVLSLGTSETAVLVRQWFSGAPPFVSPSVLNAAIRVGGITKNDRIVVRIDVEIGCDNYATRRPSGTLHGSLEAAWYGTLLTTSKPAYLTDPKTADISNVWAREGTTHIADVVASRTIHLGSQTIPLHASEQVKPCTPAPRMTCIDFVADMRVTSENGAGFSFGKFYYCWTNGKIAWNYGDAPPYSAVSALRTFDVGCTTDHLSLYDTSIGPCGTCELVQQFPTSLQPQLCYNSTADFWQPNPVPQSITVIPLTGNPETISALRYTANLAVVQGLGVVDVWLRSDNGVPVQIRWNDGKIFTFYNQDTNINIACAAALYTPSTCTSFVCGRPLDLVIVQELSKNTETTDQAGVRDFINLLITKFVFGPTNVQVGYITYAETATTKLALSVGSSRINVAAAVNATGCVGACTGKGTPSVGLAAGVAMLSGSTRSTAAASRVILMIINEIEEDRAAIDAVISAAAASGVYIITVAYHSGTPYDLFSAISSDAGVYGSKTQNIFYAAFQTDLSKSVHVTRVATRLCGLVPYSTTCHTCCQSLLCSPAGTLCDDTPCSNQVITCPIYYAEDGVSLHCDLTYVKDMTTGCCKVTFRTTSPCITTPNATCHSQTCNRTSGLCLTSNGCNDPPAGGCRDRLCSADPPYTCQEVTRSIPPQPPGCVDLRCNPETNDFEWYGVGCSDIEDLCQQRTCNEKTCEITIRPDPAPHGNKCIPRVCINSSGGWQNGTAVGCSSPGPCVNSHCDPATGSCINTQLYCGTPSDLCQNTTCIGLPNQYTCNGALPVEKVCTPDPCYTSAECVPATGQCVSSGLKTCAFDSLTGCTRKCNTSTNQCENNTCPPPPPPGCSASCLPTPCSTYECQVIGLTSFCAGPTPRDCTKEIDASNTCQYTDGCLSSGPEPGCQIKTRNCSRELQTGVISFPPTLGQCGLVFQDPTHPDCCTFKTRTCPNTNPCVSINCDPIDGQCKVTNLCQTTNPCFPVLCTPTGCVETPLCPAGLMDEITCASKKCTVDSFGVASCGNQAVLGCIPQDNCKNGTCNNQTKTCGYTPLCVNNSNDKCTHTYCNATGGFCYAVKETGFNSSGCKRSGCDPETGPYTYLDHSKCQDGNPCFISTCKSDGTCDRIPYDCTGKLPNQSYCKPAICQDFLGCQLVDRDCLANSTVGPDGTPHHLLFSSSTSSNNTGCQVCECIDCTPSDTNLACLPHSKKYTGYCTTTSRGCVPLSVPGGVIAAIVVGGVIAALALVGVGAGLAAAAHASWFSSKDERVHDNPLFKEKGCSGAPPW